PFTRKITYDSLNWIHNYTITDENGNVAYFGNGNEEFSNISYSGGGYVSPNVPPRGVTSWYLSKLQTYTKEIATFQYDTLDYSYVKTIAESYTKRNPINLQFDQYHCNCGNSSINIENQNCEFLDYIIKKIITPTETIQFYYSTDNNLNLYKRQLDSIIVTDNSLNKTIKKIGLKYGMYSGVNLLRLDAIWDYAGMQDSILIASFHYKLGNLAGISSLARDLFNYNNGFTGNTYLISTVDTSCPSVYRAANRSVTLSITNGVLDTIRYATEGRSAFFYSANRIDTLYGPGIKVDSIKYLSDASTIISKTAYTYSKPQNALSFNGNINNNSVNNDNSDCPVKTFNSELFSVGPINPFYYQTIEIRKYSTDTAQIQLTKEIYTNGVDGYVGLQPIISQKFYFRNNNVTDTLRIEKYDYSFLQVDSLNVELNKLGPSYLPTRYYTLDGISTNNNQDVCRILYDGVGSNGIIYPRITLPTKITTIQFDQNNNLVQLIDSTNKFYNSYWQIQAEKKLTSQGKLDSVLYNYLYSNNNSIATSAITNNLFGIIDKTIRYTNSLVKLEKSRTNYSVQSNGLILPDSFFVQRLLNSEEISQIVTGYDVNGNTTEFNKHGLYSAFLRDYGNQLVIAFAINGRFNEIAYTSFESDGSGNWTIGSAVRNPSDAITGKYSYALSNGNISKIISNLSKSYIVSFWSKNGTATVNGNSSSISLSRNGWTYNEILLPAGTSSVTINGSGTTIIDELRLYPSLAQMSTFTYQPLIGITSKCDLNNRIEYYEYDGYGRLSVIRDLYGNIIKTYAYLYVNN
ncbi:MAG: hypothetical protein ACJ748_00175, partial [Flavisolibacter sp.]